MSIKSRVPWFVKVPSKILLSRLPVPHRVWHRVGLFRNGSMDDSRIALEVYHRHAVQYPNRGERPFSMLELGPGDSIATGLIASARGATQSYLVDGDPFAATDVAAYTPLFDLLEAEGSDVVRLRKARTFEELCLLSSTKYLTRGLESLKTIPDSSVDFVMSNAVLEHVRKADFKAVVDETRRVLRPGGVCSHEVDLRDHLSGALNNLRFSERVWESGLMASSGFYTNRIRYKEMLEVFRASGFAVRIVERDEWDGIPTPRSRFSREFREFDEEDLLIKSFRVCLTI